MRFPLKDWIDAHPHVRHSLAESGMHGTIRPGPAPRERFDRGLLTELEAAVARDLGVARDRVFLTHGATEANAIVVAHLARRRRNGKRKGRIALPEYPPLVDLLRLEGLGRAPRDAPADIAVISRPRNPEGDVWSRARLFGWAAHDRALVVDETFREFAAEPSLARLGRPGLWTTGTFTKFWGADHLRVGWAVAPPEEVDRFRRRFGLVVDELPPASAAGALALLEDGERIRGEVRRVLDRNRAALRRRDPALAPPVAPVAFDRTAGSGDRLARAALRASVLVCPGRFFGDRRGVRISLTRRSFPADLDAYLAVRGGLVGRLG